MSNIKIVALVTVKPEYTETLVAQFKELVKASRAEEGNISYDLHQEIGKPNRFVFVENWKSQAAIDEHNASAHFQALRPVRRRQNRSVGNRIDE